MLRLTHTELSDLEAKAKAATPGQWLAQYEWGSGCNASICHIGDWTITTMDESYEFHAGCDADAHHIAAANPATVLRLINTQRELVTVLTNLLGASERHIFSTECQAERDAARNLIAEIREGRKK